MSEPGSDPFRIEPLGTQHGSARAGFTCGVESLDRYLNQQASQDQQRGLAATQVLIEIETGAIAGYYALAMTSILPRDLPPGLARRLPRQIALPALLFGRLAVDTRFRGRRLGERLLIDALRRFLMLQTDAGAVAVVVDAIDDSARAFYERYGFQRLLEQPYRLVMARRTVERLVAG